MHGNVISHWRKSPVDHKLFKEPDAEAYVVDIRNMLLP